MTFMKNENNIGIGTLKNILYSFSTSLITLTLSTIATDN